MNEFDRFKLLIGENNFNIIKNKRILIVGVGGVGGYVLETLARSGIENITIIDNDIIDITNLNRQIISLNNNVGSNKVDVAKERILKINPNAKINTYMADEIENGEESIIDSTFSYIIDAVDTVSTKLKLIERASKLNVPIISAMGAGNKLDPTRFEVTDIYKTSVCPLAKVMRKELKNRGIKKLKVVYSKEQPIKHEANEMYEKRVPGSIAFVPSVVGLIIASEVIKDILK